MRRIAFVSLTPGTGKSMLIHHIAVMLAELGETVLVVDLDPQVHLTSLLVAEERLEILWTGAEHPYSICGALRSVSRGGVDVLVPHVEGKGSRIGVVVGDPALAGLEGSFSDAWIRYEAGDPRTFSAVTAVDRAVRRAAKEFGAAWVLIDTAQNLDAITRSALIASDSVVIPLAPDLYSYQGLLTLGPTLRAWQSRWAELQQNHPEGLQPRAGEPLGYVVMQHGMTESRPAKAYQRWIFRFPAAYRESVLDLVAPGLPRSADEDVHCLAVLKHYRSLLPMALKARKPVFALTPADGAIGAHADAAKLAYFEFAALVKRLADASILPR